MIKKFIDYTIESNISDINMIKSDEISKSFTISLEIELETKDKSGVDVEYSKNQKKSVIGMISDRINSQLLKFNNLDTSKVDKYKEFIRNLLSEIEYNIHIDDDYVEEITDPSEYSDEIEYGIVQLVEPLVNTYFYHDNIFYLKNKLKSKLPNFWRKWKDSIKYEVDNTLERGIEISMKTHIKGIDSTIDFIEDFYQDFELQNYWKFRRTTGIHINIGVNYDTKWNIIKGLLLLSDDNNKFLFKNIETRKNLEFTQSIKKAIFDLPNEEKEKILSKVDLHNIEEVEEYFNKYLYKLVKQLGYKNFGFNITSIVTDNYVEFRYPGGNITKSTLIDKLIYFCFIVYCMTNPNYKRREYQKKIYKFFDELSVF